MIYISLILIAGILVYGIRLFIKNRAKFEDQKSLIEYLFIFLTILFTVINIQSSTDDFNNVIQRFDNILSVINRKPDLKIEFGIDPNDTTFEITKITLKNDGDLMARVYMMKIIMPNTGFKVIDPIFPKGFKLVHNYDNANLTLQRSDYPPKYILPGDSLGQMIDVNSCDIVYDKTLNLQFKVYVYYQADYGHDGMVNSKLTIFKP